MIQTLRGVVIKFDDPKEFAEILRTKKIGIYNLGPGIGDHVYHTYFPEIYYWTSGDGSESIYNFIKSLKIKVKYFKIPHHGNNCTQSQAKGLKSQGCNVCWYNDLEPKGIGTTDRRNKVGHQLL